MSQITSGNSDHYRESQRFRLQRHARTGSRGDRQRAGIGRADRRSDRGDFIFGLKSRHAEILVPRKLVQNVRSRRDRIRTLKERAARIFATPPRIPAPAPGCRSYCGNARRKLRRRNLVGDLKRFGRFAIRIARPSSPAYSLPRATASLQICHPASDRWIPSAGCRASSTCPARRSFCSGPCSSRRGPRSCSAARVSRVKLHRKQAVAIQRMVFQRIRRRSAPCADRSRRNRR